MRWSRHSCCAAAVVLSAGSAFAADTYIEESPNALFPADGTTFYMHNEVNDLRVGGTLGATPTISEDIATSNGNVHYAWNGKRTTGGGPDLTYLKNLRPRSDSPFGLLLGVEGQYRYFNITPESYTTTAGNSPNANNGIALTYQEANLDALIGIGTRALYTRYGEFDFEVMGFAGGGLTWADTIVPGSLQVVRGTGSSWNAGPRLGVVWDNQRWNFGVHGDWVFTKGRTTINLPGGLNDTMHSKSSAPAGTVELGYRF